MGSSPTERRPGRPTHLESLVGEFGAKGPLTGSSTSGPCDTWGSMTGVRFRSFPLYLFAETTAAQMRFRRFLQLTMHEVDLHLPEGPASLPVQSQNSRGQERDDGQK